MRHLGNTDDLVLNTGKMRDAWIIQAFAQASPTLDRKRIIHTAVRNEIGRAL